ncbi:hypothetical protein H5410_017050 [Solanum commersonii]|uniref:Uncharacterized protein n=1 Tax=Solanum commersonii TaxID=4109 RepID=A0A9J5ZYY6_SOLCO|nr:hypothetical protein H5410_017050 [Solanum commersonii]
MGFGRRWSYCLVVLAEVPVMERLSLVWPTGFIRRRFYGSDDRSFLALTGTPAKPNKQIEKNGKRVGVGRWFVQATDVVLPELWMVWWWRFGVSSLPGGACCSC